MRSRSSVPRIAAVVAAFGWAPAGRAGADLRSTRAEVEIREDGSALVTWWCLWKADQSRISGFFLEGTGGLPRFNRGGTAALESGEKVPLVVSPAPGNRWDVAMEGGRSFGPGEATFVFSYLVDLVDSGAAGATLSPEGEPFAWIRWTPPVWSEPIESQELTFRFPTLAVSEGPSTRYAAWEATGLRIADAMAQANTTSWAGEASPGARGPSLVSRFRREPLPVREAQTIELFVPAKALPGVIAAVTAAEARRIDARRRDDSAQAWQTQLHAFTRWFVVVPASLGLVAVTLAASRRKHAALAMAAAGTTLSGVAEPDAEAAARAADAVRRPGKVADLTAIEALVLMGMPFGPLFAMSVDAMAAEGGARREGDDPAPRVGRGSRPSANPFLSWLHARLPAEPGPVSAELVRDFGLRVLGTAHRNAWDSDLDATVSHYREHFARRYPNFESLGDRQWHGPIAPAFFPWWVARHHRRGPGVWVLDSLDAGDGFAFLAGDVAGRMGRMSASDFGGGGALSTWEPRACPLAEVFS